MYMKEAIYGVLIIAPLGGPTGRIKDNVLIQRNRLFVMNCILCCNTDSSSQISSSSQFSSSGATNM